VNASVQRIGLLSAVLVAGVIPLNWHSEKKAAASWDQKAAATYLDQRAAWWFEWPKSARDHETFCISCHTAVPYALSRPALRKPLAETAPTPNERRLLDNVTKRVHLWKEVAPFYSTEDRGGNKTVESRGTESVLNALILASRDAQTGHLSSDARTAFDNMWSEQLSKGEKKGSWVWLRFANEPWEADDSDFYGATLAAIAVGSAPGNYRSTPEIQNNLNLLREFLNRESSAQPTINRVVLLWASTKVPGLLDPQSQKAIITEVLAKQQPDGGWSLSSLIGDWKRHDGTAQEGKSDGYATGLITLALQQAGIPRDNAQQNQGLAWLVANQDKKEGYWPSYSLNNNVQHHMSPDTVRFMNDAATAYAVLALTHANTD
jgi:squalene-hopene/tetraprenyl-beta-curcumene cyclase